METTARTTEVDGFTYQTTAPERRISRTCQHYVQQAADARSGLCTPVLDLTLDAAIRAAAEVTA